MIPYEFIYSLTTNVLNIDESIRWVGITNKEGLIINEKYRKGVMPLLTEEENEDYASHTVERHRKRLKFQPKLGELEYALVRYESVNRAIIPINKNYYLLIAIDVEENDVDKIIVEKVIPSTRKRDVAGLI